MIAAGVNAKALSTYIGHEDIATTLNKYGHLMPGNEEQAAGLLDAYLDAAGGVIVTRLARRLAVRPGAIVLWAAGTASHVLHLTFPALRAGLRPIC